MYINFVMSSNVKSKIFDDIYKYFFNYSEHKCFRSIEPVDNADVYYYFRPHLEKKLKPNSVVTVHHDLNETCNTLDSKLFIERYKESKIITCLNSDQLKYLKNIGINNTVIIPHGYNKKLLKENIISTNVEKINIGFFSSYYERLVKGEPYLLNILSKLPIDKYKVTLLGNNRQNLQIDIKNLGFECNLFENIPYSKINLVYKDLHFLLITSNYEGGPASVPEALATTTPILTRNVGMIKDLNNSKGIFLLNDNDIESDINTINYIVNNLPKIKKDIKEKTFFSLKSWQNVIKLYDNTFERTCPNIDKRLESVVKVDFMLTNLIYYFRTLHFKKKIKKYFIKKIKGYK